MTQTPPVGLHKYFPDLADYASAIGWACIEIAYLESLLDSCLWVSLGVQEWSAMNCITGHSDINQKAMMLKGLAFQNKKDETWFEQVRDALNSIRGLQERRNRYVHDQWVPGTKGPELARKMVSIKKPQSHQPEKLITYESRPVDVSEVWQLVADISHTHSKIFVLFTEAYGVLEPVSRR